VITIATGILQFSSEVVGLQDAPIIMTRQTPIPNGTHIRKEKKLSLRHEKSGQERGELFAVFDGVESDPKEREAEEQIADLMTVERGDESHL
jgi:hypothetical protein